VRIVSLIASSTEIVCALGLQESLVARSHECDFPPSVKRLPAVTAPKFPTDGTSYQIDQRVKAILAEGLSVYRVDAARLAELAPDVIVTQTQCEVCAVSEKDVEAAVCTFIGSRPRIVSCHPDKLADVWADIRRVAAALDVVDRGEALVASLIAGLSGLPRPASRPRVAFVDWIDPLFPGGNWMPELVELAGGESVTFSTWEQLVAARPDVTVVAPCGFDLARTRAEMPARDWRQVGGRVVIADGNQFFNRPGPRLVESARILSEIFQG
jgi:iron complex transport system substrate-binding protein